MTAPGPGSPAGPWREPPPGVPSSYDYPRVRITRLLDDAASDFPTVDAVDFAGHRLTYKALVDQVDRLATAMAGLGVASGDRVGLLLPSAPQLVIGLFAAARAGAVAVLLDAQAEASTLEEEVNDAGCGVLICLAAAYERLAALKGRLPTVTHLLATGLEDYLPFPRNLLYPLWGPRGGMGRRIPKQERVVAFKDLIRRTAPAAHEPHTHDDEVAAVTYEHGHAHVFTHAALVAGAFQMRLWVPDVQAGRERLLVATDLTQPFGLAGMLGLGVLAASTMVLTARHDAGAVKRVASRRAPSLLVAAPSVFAELASDAQDLSDLRVGLASGPMEARVAELIHDRTGARVRGGLAVPGAAGLVHANPVYGRAKYRSAGLALPDTQTVILDTEGAPLPAGEVGILAVSGPQTARLADRGPWVVTRQRGHLDGEGYLWLEG